MTRSSLLARRIALPVTAALVGGTFATLGVAAPAQAGGSQAVEKTFVYTCDVVAGGLGLGKHDINVTAVAKAPTTAFRGERIPATPVSITLGMPEDLRKPTVALVGGYAAEGSSTDAAITLSSGGRTTAVRIPSLKAAKTDIPQTESTPWTIPAKGVVPSIVTPNTLKGSAVLGLPAAFTVTATLYVNRPSKTAPATLDCTSTADLALATVKQVNAAPKASRALTVKVKKNKAKKFTIRATDADGDRLSFKAGKVAKKAGKVSVKGRVLTFTPRKGFKGKSTVNVAIRDGKGGSATTKVTLVVK